MRRKHTSARAGHRAAPAIAACVVALLAGLLAGPAPAAAGKGPRQLRGVVLHSLWPQNSLRDIDRDLDTSRRLGSRVVKVDVGWASLEPGRRGQRSAWYVKRLDRFMAGARRRGIKVIATLWATPCWASTAPWTVKRDCGGVYDLAVVNYPPYDPGDYAAVARWLAARYRRTLTAIEVWNEPDLGTREFWRGDAWSYTALVRAAYPAIKGADGGIAVLAGAMAGADQFFLSQLYEAGARGYYDGISVHPYGAWEVRRLGSLHAFQRASGDGSDLWVTEFGAPTGLFPGWRLDARQQARAISRDFGRLGRMRFVRAATLYSLRDAGWSGTDLSANFGLLRPNFSPKPSFAAARAALRGG